MRNFCNANVIITYSINIDIDIDISTSFDPRHCDMNTLILKFNSNQRFSIIWQFSKMHLWHWKSHVVKNTIMGTELMWICWGVICNFSPLPSWSDSYTPMMRVRFHVQVSWSDDLRLFRYQAVGSPPVSVFSTRLRWWNIRTPTRAVLVGVLWCVVHGLWNCAINTLCAVFLHASSTWWRLVALSISRNVPLVDTTVCWFHLTASAVLLMGSV